MLAWSLAKLQGRTWSNGKGRDASSFLAYLAEVAHGRLSEFSPQSISNIAWALATANVLGEEEACCFLTAAALAAAPQLAQFPSQAISNLCWAVGQMSRRNTAEANPNRKIAKIAAIALAEAASQQAMHRTSEFRWQDLSTVIVALSHGRHLTATTNRLGTLQVIRATNACHKLSTQVMLNIAMSVTRLATLAGGSGKHRLRQPMSMVFAQDSEHVCVL